MKSSRQNEIINIIQNEEVETQEQLLELLKQRGYSTTQATISRDIKELHLIKLQTGVGNYRYSVAGSRLSQSAMSRLRTIFREAVTSFDTAQNIVVINTMPGLASAACSALDSMEISGMVGSLAGDDTVFLAMRSSDDASAFCAEINKMLV